MGAIAEAISEYARPLLEQTDGSFEQVEKAFAISTLCYNLALLPQEKWGSILSEMRASTDMDEVQFEEFLREVVGPMIQRHKDMFPFMHGRAAARPRQSLFAEPAAARENAAASPKPAPPADRYAPCPCGSGEKYKFCCGAKRR